MTRRTKRQKIKAQKRYKNLYHLFDPNKQVSILPSSDVKSQFSPTHQEAKSISYSNNNAESTDYYLNTKQVKIDITKSLIISSLILSLELVLYYIWFRI